LLELIFDTEKGEDALQNIFLAEAFGGRSNQNKGYQMHINNACSPAFLAKNFYPI
jgi:hypothetical protein